ncbi:MAG: DUF3198 domain-containing protein [Thermoplasmataceae archaeon]
MITKWKDYQFFIYLILLAVSVLILIISMNDVLFHNNSFSAYFMTFSPFGNWVYWIFAAGIIFTIIFFYLFYRVILDMRKFDELVSKGSKFNFVKSLKELRTISKRLGPRYQRLLSEAMEKFKVK